MNNHLNIHTIGFRNNVITCPNDNRDNRKLVDGLQFILLRFGYLLSSEAIEELSKADSTFIEYYTENITAYLEDFIGSTRGYTLEDVYNLNIPGVTTSLNSFIDLITKNSLKASDDIECPFKDIQKYDEFTLISYVTEEKFKSIFTNLVSINTSITPADFKIVGWFAETYGNDNIMPKEVPFKENLCMLASLMMDVPVRTSTDILRIAMYLSNGHTQLNLPPRKVRLNSWSRQLSDNPVLENYKMKSFPRAQRRYILGLLNEVANPKEMVLKIGQWLRLGERLHPGDYRDKFPKAFDAFNDLRNNKIYSWYSDVDKAFNKSFENGILKLMERPGEFGRRLDSLYRNNDKKKRKLVLEMFVAIAPKISNKVLWELYRHFAARENTSNRTVTLPNARRSVQLPALKPLSLEDINSIQGTLVNCLQDKFKLLEPLGNIYIDEKLKDIPVPTNMRTISDSLVTSIRGGRMPLGEEKKAIRMFVYWTSSSDIDISASLFSKKNGKAVCAYTSTRPCKGVHHSGDVIPSRRGEWSEYIDINYTALDGKYDYAIVSIRNFTGNPMSDNGGVAGIAEFDSHSPSQTWDPTAVKNSFKLESQGGTIILFAVDLNTKEWILIDQDQEGIPVEVRNNTEAFLEYTISAPKLSAYDVLLMHAQVRGEQVVELDKADTVFSFNDFSISYEKLAGYML